MVEVEIRAPIFDEEGGQMIWRAHAFVRADGHQLDFYGDETLVARDMPVVSLATGQSVHADDDAEEWARNLPHAYRAGDLVAVLVHDDAPHDVPEARHDAPLPSIPEAPVAGRDASEATFAG